MFLLDENVSELEVLRLRKCGIRVRLVGDEVADIGTSDENLLPALLRLKQPILFTQDEDFFRRSRLHPRYGLVWLDVRATEAAEFICRFLKHPEFDTQAKRLGTVSRVHPMGIDCWRGTGRQLHKTGWPAA
jgi:hypothetical protein